MSNQKPDKPKPPWLKRRIPAGAEHERVRNLVERSRLHTVCQEARCPNIWECFSSQTATFLILGSVCTRNCGFCAVTAGSPAPLDPSEPDNVAEAASKMKLKYVVITSVTRDDLPDGGSGVFAETIKAVRSKNPAAMIEVLVPDFQGSPDALRKVVEAYPDVLNHNLETVPRLYQTVRPQAIYGRSLELLQRAGKCEPSLQTKSGLMLGLGEMEIEVEQTLNDLLEVGCRMLTMGQYLQPTKSHLPVERFIPPEEFNEWKDTALKMGFKQVASGPFVRSSYHAKELFNATKIAC
ncbi:MAG TPA: lipoyl synthase [Deltaproteobacteria bacterium]|nr:lipoyl synthase [Deltaproteobacteria bacterium]